MNHQDRPCYEFGAFRLDVSEQMLLRDGRPLPLTPKLFDLLRVLVENGGHLVEKDQLLKELWPDSFVEEGALNRGVSVLRKALGESASGPKYIETVPKRGYRFVAPVRRLAGRSVSVAEPSRAAVWRRPARVIGVLLAVATASYVMLGTTVRERKAPPPAPTHRQVSFTGREGAPALSPDGTRVAYVSDETPSKRLMVQELAGGPPLAIFSAPEVGHLRWSPDGSQLILWARGAGNDGIYILPHLGGTPRRIMRGQYLACWSPDGSTIAVASYLAGKIWFLDTLGRERRLVSLQGVRWSIWDIDWSPVSGLLTLVSSDEQGRFDIWTIRPDGGDQRSVVTLNAEVSAARWAPQGDAIYYFQRQNQTASLEKVHVRSGDEGRSGVATTLISGLEVDGSFSLSADASRLVYARSPYYSNLWLLDAGGHGTGHRTTTRQLTNGTSLIERPSVSPDGSSIVFNMGREGLANLYTMPIGGGSPKQLTFLDSFNLGGVWSADGRRIAFASTRGGKPGVWTVEADGGIPRPLASRNLSDSFDLAWSPVSRILYQQAGNRNYGELDPETSEERYLVRDSSVGWLFSPVYSPDGRKIAVAWNRRPSRGIWVIDAKDGHETPVYATSAGSDMPVGWSPDGRFIYLVEAKNSTYRGLTAPLGETVTDAKILMVSANGGDVTTVAALPFEEVGSVSMTPDGRRFVLTVYSSRSDVWVVDNFDGPPRPIATFLASMR